MVSAEQTEKTVSVEQRNIIVLTTLIAGILFLFTRLHAQKEKSKKHILEVAELTAHITQLFDQIRHVLEYKADKATSWQLPSFNIKREVIKNGSNEKTLNELQVFEITSLVPTGQEITRFVIHYHKQIVPTRPLELYVISDFNTIKLTPEFSSDHLLLLRDLEKKLLTIRSQLYIRQKK